MFKLSTTGHSKKVATFISGHCRQIFLIVLASFCLQEQDWSPVTGSKPTSALSSSHSQLSKGLSKQQLQLHAKQSFTFDEDDEDWMVAPDKPIKKKHHKFLANR